LIAFIESASKCELSELSSTLFLIFLTKLTILDGIGAHWIDESFRSREQACHVEHGFPVDLALLFLLEDKGSVSRGVSSSLFHANIGRFIEHATNCERHDILYALINFFL